MVMVRYLYGLKSSGASWRNMSAETFHQINFVLTVADSDVYSRRVSKPNGKEYYELLLLYVDEVLCCSYKPKLIIDVLELA